MRADEADFLTKFLTDPDKTKDAHAIRNDLSAWNTNFLVGKWEENRLSWGSGQTSQEQSADTINDEVQFEEDEIGDVLGDSAFVKAQYKHDYAHSLPHLVKLCMERQFKVMFRNKEVST